MCLRYWLIQTDLHLTKLRRPKTDNARWFNEFGYPRFYQPTFDQPPKTNLENAITSLCEQRPEEMARERSDISPARVSHFVSSFFLKLVKRHHRELPRSRLNEQQRVPPRDNDRHPSALCRFVQPQFPVLALNSFIFSCFFFLSFSFTFARYEFE